MILCEWQMSLRVPDDLCWDHDDQVAAGYIIWRHKEYYNYAINPCVKIEYRPLLRRKAVATSAENLGRDLIHSEVANLKVAISIKATTGSRPLPGRIPRPRQYSRCP
jgi:hypothetical protein